MEAEGLLGDGRIEDARAIVVGVRAELAAIDELTAPISLTWMFVERLEKRLVVNG
jgi:hypothetical protein